MDRREFLQAEWVDVFCSSLGNKYVLNLFQRTGKTPVTLKILQKLDLLDKKILISYPDNKILPTWTENQDKFNIYLTNVTYTNTASIEKFIDESYDCYIFDECTDFSEREAIAIAKIVRETEYVIALSGTISKESEEKLKELFDLEILIKYSNKEAIQDSLISDYEIEIVQVPLSEAKTIVHKKGHMISEKRKFDSYTYVINQMREEKKDPKFLYLHRNRILQGSITKSAYVREMLRKYSEERVLVFTGLTKVADGLGIASFHSKSKDKTVFDKFLNKEINQMAVAKMGGSGVTYPSLDRVILTAFTYDEEDTSQLISRCMVLDYAEKKAKITIITSNEEVELKKLRKTLKDFDTSKINWK